jgi:hypothetical protein
MEELDLTSTEPAENRLNQAKHNLNQPKMDEISQKQNT